MTCKDVYLLARTHLPVTEEICTDYGTAFEVPMDVEARVMPLLGGLILELKELAAAYSRMKLEDYADWLLFFPKCIDGPLPLPDRFLGACAYYLASRLLLAKNPQLAQVLHNFHLDSIGAIRIEIPASVDRIMDNYSHESSLRDLWNRRAQENCCEN